MIITKTGDQLKVTSLPEIKELVVDFVVVIIIACYNNNNNNNFVFSTCIFLRALKG